MKRAGELRLPFDHDERAFCEGLERLGVGSSHRILRKSLDARNKQRIQWVYAIGIPEPGDDDPPVFLPRRPPDPPVVIVGSGPAGLFAAHWLALHGVSSTIVEQGEPLRARLRTMARFMRAGRLDPSSNLCFGAGGAGAYSDGKLATRTRSPHIPFIMETLVRFGAPRQTRYLHAPHLGSSGIRRVIGAMIAHLLEQGVQLRFGARVASLSIASEQLTGLVLDSGERIEAPRVLLGTGHSARELYRELARIGLPIALKPFAVGARLEHPAALIDRIQHGRFAGHPALGPARYQLAHTWPEGVPPLHPAALDPAAPRQGREDRQAGKRALYSFCMCPGGFILNTATEPGGVVTNGMSNVGRRGRHSNAAMVVNVEAADLAGDDPLRGLAWQEQLEQGAAGSVNRASRCHALPGQRLLDFLEGRAPRALPATSALVPVRAAGLHEILPAFVVEAMRRGFEPLGRRMRGLVGPEAVLVGVETRTSSPLRLLRDPTTRQSPGAVGLYPVGEGAGYAGGIISAAADGIESAEHLLSSLPCA